MIRNPSHKLLLTLLSLVILALAGCSAGPEIPLPASATDMPDYLLIGLSNPAVHLEQAISDSYHPDPGKVRFAYVHSNHSRTLTDLRSGFLSATLAHEVPEKSDLWHSPIALDGVVMAVAADNPVPALTTPELTAILAGRVTNWQQVGGRDQPIQVAVREAGATSRNIIEDSLLIEERLTTAAIVLPNPAELIRFAAGEPGALIITFLGSTGGSDHLKFLTLDGIAPSPDTVASQEYPLTSPLYFLSVEEPSGELRGLLAWLQSAEGQAAIGGTYGPVR